MRLLLLNIFLILLFQSSAQTLMTIGEVFDFQVGDEFQYYDYTLQSPNRDRITVTSRTNGANSVTYELAHDSYYTTFNGSDLDYNFWTDTQTVQYNMLSSSIYTLDPYQFSWDTIIETDNCGVDVHGYDFCDTTQFEVQCYARKYGRGIGIKKDYLMDYTMPPFTSPQTNLLMTYYKKGSVECGTRDNTSLSMDELIHSDKKKLIQVFDLMGRETEDKPNTLLIYIYSDGTTKKVFRVE